MKRRHLIVSVLLLFHLVVVTVAAIPPTQDLPVGRAVRHPSEDDWLSRFVRPALDSAFSRVARAHQLASAAVLPLRPLADIYSRAGLSQRWPMFADPQASDRYVRLRYYVATDPFAIDVTRFQEVVLPVDRDRFAWYFRGKSIRNALDSYLKRRATDPDVLRDPAPHELAPLARYSRNQFRRSHLTAGTIVRTEVWYGEAPIPARGERLSSGVLAARADALAEYRPEKTTRVLRHTYPRSGAAEREADVEWVLIYVDSGDGR